MKDDRRITFAEMLAKIIAAREGGGLDKALRKLRYDPHHLECVLQPTPKGDCANCDGLPGHCPGKTFVDCFLDNVRETSPGTFEFIGLTPLCAERVDAAMIGSVGSSKDLMAVLAQLRKADRPIYAVIAPAFNAQFGGVGDGELRTAFKRLGFSGMVEVSLFADILTLREALAFDAMIQNEADYMLTSCCCPVWIQMIRKLHPGLLGKVPGSVSPMVAAGRVVKRLVEGAVTVFVGPCLAKKAEAREPDIADAIDHVLTFREVADLFAAARIDPTTLPADRREHSSFAGRIYAVARGVSEAVAVTLDRVRPGRPIRVRAVQADGVPECKRLLDDVEAGRMTANFLEGMGCAGGCVGGPRALIDRGTATGKVRSYADASPYPTPIDNPYVVELLHRLGIDTIDQLLDEDSIFARTL